IKLPKNIKFGKGNPDFIEVKGYVHVGASRDLLERKHMPNHEEIQDLSNKLIDLLPDYQIIDDQKASKVFCLMKKGMKRYIDFAKFFEGKWENALDYSSDEMQPNF
ncbi:hypothetical protein ACFLZZ_02755, partial [Nanoarchaeota archaeon]